jgi:hypothetical protein
MWHDEQRRRKIILCSFISFFFKLSLSQNNNKKRIDNFLRMPNMSAERFQDSHNHDAKSPLKIKDQLKEQRNKGQRLSGSDNAMNLMPASQLLAALR